MPPEDPEISRWFQRNVQPHEPMLRAWLRSRFSSENDIDDIVQESYVRLLRARDTGALNSPKAFLFAIARNLAKTTRCPSWKRARAFPKPSLASRSSKS
jgi:DNA-directed RNA polymerase specialized sigma24 family protein